MASYPTLRCGSTVLNPLVRTTRVPTTILKFEGGQEQRFRKAAPLEAFKLSHTGITKTEVANIRTFYEACKGPFDQTWDISIGGTTYSNMYFEGEPLRVEEQSNGKYSVSISIGQRR